jgi:F420H(2)-dependent quinone reductase
VVQVGDAILVRSIRGRRGGWFRRLRAKPDGEVGDGAHIHPVRARPVQDAGTVEAVTGADAAKDGDSP